MSYRIAAAAELNAIVLHIAAAKAMMHLAAVDTLQLSLGRGTIAPTNV